MSRKKKEPESPTLLEACERVLDWLSSFSMPPTSTIAEKQEHMAILEAAINRHRRDQSAGRIVNLRDKLAACRAALERVEAFENAWEEMRTSILHEGNSDQSLDNDQINHVLSIIDSEYPAIVSSPPPEAAK